MTILGCSGRRYFLYGLDICPRAAQLAELALVFKAREKSRRFFQPEHLVRPNIIELREVSFDEGELSTYFKTLGVQPSAIHPELNRLLHQCEEAKNFGSLIQPCMNEQEIQSARSAISHLPSSNRDLMVGAIHAKVLRVLEQAAALTQRYHVVVANPPYMGSSAMNPALKTYIEERLTSGKTDTYSAFMLRNLRLVLSRGYVGMITIPNWMFIRSFEDLRKTLLSTTGFVNFVHCGRGVWGADFGSCAFVLVSNSSGGHVGCFRRLFRRQGEVQTNEEIEANFLDPIGFPPHSARPANFQKVPGSPIAYWAGEKT